MSQSQTEEAVAVAVDDTPSVSALGSVDEYLQLAQQYDCSDLHLATGSPPMWRRYGTLQPIWANAALLTSDDTKQLDYNFLGDSHTKTLEKRGDVDFA
jgi:twitching motility protein PilT